MILRAFIVAVITLWSVDAFSIDHADPTNTLPNITPNSSSYTRTRTFLGSEDADRYDEQFTDFVVTGGIHSTAGGLSATPSDMIGYVGGYRITQAGVQITYTNTSTCWVIADGNTTGNVSPFIRVTGSHYLTYCGATKPALPTDAIWLMAVTTSGGGITTVGDIRASTAVGTVGPEIDARAFGVKCTGSSDDTAGIQAAIDSVKGATVSPTTDEQPGVGGTIVLPAGQCKVSSAIRLTGANYNHNISIRGQGPLATVVRSVNSAGANVIEVIGDGTASVHGFQLEDLTIQGNFAAGRCLYVEKTIRNVVLRDVAFYDCGAGGVYLYNTSNRIVLDSVRIENEDISSYSTLSVPGLELQTNAEQVWSYGLSVRGFAVGILVGGYNNGFLLSGGDITKNALGVHVYGSASDDGHVSASTIEGVYFEANGADIEVANASTSCTTNADCNTTCISSACADDAAKNINVLHNTFSQSCGKDKPYDCVDNTGTPITGTVCQVEFNRVAGGSIIGNEFRKTSSTDVDCSIQLASASRNINVDGNTWPEDGMPDENRTGLTKFTNAGNGNKYNVGGPIDVTDVCADASGVTDNSECFASLFNVIGDYWIPPGTYKLSRLVRITKADHVHITASADATLLYDGACAWGGVIVVRNADDITWNGGTINSDNQGNDNAMASTGQRLCEDAGWSLSRYCDTNTDCADVGSCSGGFCSGLGAHACTSDSQCDAIGDAVCRTDHVKRLRIENLHVKNTRSAIPASCDDQISANIGEGGGKGISLQFGIEDAFVNNIVMDDCDIGLSIECKSVASNNGGCENIFVNNVSIRDSSWMGLYLLGSGGVPPAEGDIQPIVMNNIQLDNCAVDRTAQGAVTAESAFNYQIRNLRIRNSSGAVTPWRGVTRQSDVEMYVDVNDAHNILDFTKAESANGSVAISRYNKFDVYLKLRTALASTTLEYMVADDGTNIPMGSDFDVQWLWWDGFNFESNVWPGGGTGGNQTCSAATCTSGGDACATNDDCSAYFEGPIQVSNSYRFKNMSKGDVVSSDFIVRGAAPTFNAAFIGQTVVDKPGDDVYVATAVGGGASDWEKVSP